jgi:hypothetical protein
MRPASSRKSDRAGASAYARPLSEGRIRARASAYARPLSEGRIHAGASACARPLSEGRIHAGASACARPRLGSPIARERRRLSGLSRKAGYTPECLHAPGLVSEVRSRGSVGVRPASLGRPDTRRSVCMRPTSSRKSGYTQERLHAPGLVSEVRIRAGASACARPRLGSSDTRRSVCMRPAFRNLDTRGSDGVRPAASRSGGESCASHGQVRRPRPKPPDCKFARLKLYLLTDGLPSMRARRGGAEDKRIRRQAVNRRSKFRQDSQRGQPACAASTPRKLAGSCPFRGTENAPGSFAPNPRLYVRRQ